MNHPKFLLAFAALAALVLVGVSLYLGMWGGLVLVAVAAAGLAWYRLQVARGREGDQFFDQGEDTRLTQMQGGSPSEMPVDRKGGDTMH